MKKKQVVIPPDEPDDYDPEKEPILKPGLLEQVLVYGVYFIAMFGVMRVVHWLFTDVFGFFPPR